MMKLIATDMDGTFLDSNKKFSPEFIDLFFKMKKKGIRFALASGNQYFRLYQKFVPMSQDMLFIAENGAYIADGAKMLYCDVVEREKVNQIIDIINQTPRVIMIMCGTKGAYILKENIRYEYEVVKYYCSYQFVDSFDDVKDDIMKMAIYDPEYRTWEVVDSIRQQLPDGVKIVTSGNEWMDIMNETVNKGVAMRYLQDKYHLEKDDCAAFGDQMNDYELLKEVKYAYAMSNAVDEIKKISYEVVLSNDEQGVVQKIKEILEEIE